MPVHNAEIADIFRRMADLLEIQGANPYRVRAYRTAEASTRRFPRSLAEMVDGGDDLTQLPGIGKTLATKIQEIVRTGELAKLEEIKRELPMELADLLEVPGLGPKRVRALHHELGIRGLKDLERVARARKIREVVGLGEKTEEGILEYLQSGERQHGRILWLYAQQIAEPLSMYLRQLPGVDGVAVAGSYRRKRETVGDLDIVAAAEDCLHVAERLVNYEDVREILSRGETRSSVVLRSGIQVDLRVVSPASYGAALMYFTGSRSHNIAMRGIALDLGLKLNEYGLFRGDTPIAGRTEDEIYEALGLEYIPPELRENRGEIRAAGEGRLPDLVRMEDLRGDLQAHTMATDGRNTLEDLALAARERGHEYLAITDHSRRLAMTGGLDERELSQQMAEIDRLNDSLHGIVLLKGIEVDILTDGSLDLPDSILRKLDLVVGAVHSSFGLSRLEQTERIIRAMSNPHFTILAHPSGRLIGRRTSYDLDMATVIGSAQQLGRYLEVNGQPDRLDLADNYCKVAKTQGVKVSVSSDAHAVSELDYLSLGVAQARRGWLESDDVLNTRGVAELRSLLKR